MSTFTIPNNQGQIRQANDGEIFGEISESFNLDLSSSKGKIKVSNKLVKVLDYETHLGGTAQSLNDLLIWDDQYLLLTEDEAWRCSINQDPTIPANWTEVTSIGDLTINSVGTIFDSQLRITLDTDILAWNGTIDDSDWWTAVIAGSALTTGYPHVSEVVQSQKETFYVTDKDKVHYVEKGGTPKTVTLNSSVVACCLAPGLSGAMWVGTYNETSGKAQVYEIYTGEVVGSTSVYRQAYEINANAVFAIWMYNNTPYIVTSKGDIQQFNGAGFVKVAEFPFKNTGKNFENVRPGFVEAENHQRPIHPRGVKVHNDSAFININTKADDTVYAVNTRTHSGVWEFDHTTNQLTHRFAFAHATTDYGTSRQTFSYPILVVDNQYTFLMAGGHDLVDETSSENLYMTDSSVVNQGWFVTPEITSQSVTDAYESVYHKAKTMADGEEIVMQYRTSKRDTVYGTANWISTTTFVTTSDWSNVAVGDLIRVSHGYASGDYANVTEINSSSTTYTITVDRAIGANTETSYVYSDNFKKDSTTYTSADGEFKRMGGYGTNPWIQFMVILKGDIEYRQFISKANSKNEL